MRKLFLLIVLAFTLSVANSYGQGAAYYNFRDPLHSIAAYHSSVYVEQNKGNFYTLAQCIDSCNVVSPGVAYFNYGIRLSKWRIADGLKLRDTVFQLGTQDTTADKARDLLIYNHGAKNNLVRLNDSVFLVLVTTLDTGGVRRIGIVAVDTNCKLLWMKEYNKPSCVMAGEGIYATSFQRTPYGEWVILSQSTCPVISGQSFGDAVLMKLDSNFNVLWTKLFGMPIDYNFTPSTLLLEPDGYVMGIGMTKQIPNNFWNPTIDRTLLYRVDTSGILQWNWASDINDHEGIQDLIRTPDSGYIYVGGKGKLFQGGMPGASYDFFMMAKKLDKNRQVQWQFADTMDYDIVKRILPLANGEYLLLGGTYNTPGFALYSALYRIDSVGSLRWRRKYIWDTTTTNYSGTFYDMAFCGNGDVIMTGVAKDWSSNPVGNAQQAWILKVDSNGCVGPNDPQCSPTAVETVALPTEGVQVYPNPTNGLLTVETSQPKGHVEVYNLLGQQVLREVLSGFSTTLNLSGHAAGMYYYRWVVEGKAMQSGKIVLAP